MALARGEDPPGYDDRPAQLLDDELDREELRGRYYGLLQELRILLPGVQVLVAFLLTAPFAQRFGDLDDLGRAFYGAALFSGVLSVIAFVTPTAFHRFGIRTSRSRRLLWAIRATRIGMALMVISLECALFVVGRLVFSDPVAYAGCAVVGLVTIGAWILLPAATGRAYQSPSTD